MDIILPKLETIDEVVASVKQGIAEKTGFELTDAVCPITEFDLWAGFQRATYFDEVSGRLQVVIVSQTKEHLFELFTSLIEELLRIEKIKRAGLKAVFESRHIPDDVTGFGKKYGCSDNSPYYADFLTRKIDPITFLSTLYDFEELITNDGFTGVSILSDLAFSELRLDVHKAILFFSKYPKLVGKIITFLTKSGVHELPTNVNTIAEKPHVHIGHSTYNAEFERLITLTGAKEVA